MNDIRCTIIRDLLPLYIDGACSGDSAELVEAHLQGCADCKKLCEEMSSGVDTGLADPELDGKKAFRHLRSSLIWISVALAVMVGCFVSNIGGAWYGGPANMGQFIATILYIIFWGIFSVVTKKYGLLANISFVISLLTTIAAINSLFWRLLNEGFILAALVSVFASVPFYGLRMLMDWTALYAVATVISLIWLIYTGQNLRKLKTALGGK